MLQAFPRRGISLAAVAVAALLASCATPEPEPAPAPPAPVAPVYPPLPAVSLNEGVAQAASIYVAFMREAGTIQAGFTSAEAIRCSFITTIFSSFNRRRQRRLATGN